MSITKGNEEAWFRMMLNDEETLTKMGLPLDITDEDKDTLVKTMLNNQNNNPITKTQEQTKLELPIGDIIDYNDLELGGQYLITFPNELKAEVILNTILKNSFGDDYIFKNIKGAESLLGLTMAVKSDEFPLPIQLLANIKFAFFEKEEIILYYKP